MIDDNISWITTLLHYLHFTTLGPFNTGMSVNGVFFATALASGLFTGFMGVVANLPVALAPGTIILSPIINTSLKIFLSTVFCDVFD